MDLVVENARLAERPGETVDIGVREGRIAAVAPAIEAAGERIDAGGRIVISGFVETHIHLDKSCILDRCAGERGDLDEAIAEVARQKRGFTPEDVHARAVRTLKKAVVNGTTAMRTHVEVDPVIGLKGIEGVRAAIADMAFAIDVQICVFPQEGLLNNPGTDELMVAALKDGARAVGAAPYTDSDPAGQIDRVFEMAREFDVDIDMHLDFAADPSALDLEQVCRLTEEYGWGGRVAIGHVTKLAQARPDRLGEVARMMAGAGVALTVLPATDLFLMHRDHDHAVPRGVAPAHVMAEAGVNCSLSTNNVLNPFTPFGDCSQLRMANLYANICQVGRLDTLADCFRMVSSRPARLMNREDYGIRAGAPADLVVIDATDPAMAVAEIAQPTMGFKAGRRTFTRPLPEIHGAG